MNDDAELFSNEVFRQKLKNKFESDVEKKLVENREMPVKKGLKFSRKTDIGRSKKSQADVAIAIVQTGDIQSCKETQNCVDSF